MNLRIASLVPSATETLCALGLRPHLVARTGFCVHPEGLADVPKVGGTKDVNLARLQGLAPTHVVVNVDENRMETADAMHGWPAPPTIVVTHPRSPDDAAALIGQFAAVFGAVPGVAAAAAAATAELRAELAATSAGRARRVLYLIWRDPWMTVARDTYISRLLGRAGWLTEPAVAGGVSGAARYPRLSGSEPWLADVEEVWLSSEPFAFAPEHMAEVQALCPAARVRRVDGRHLSWWGVGTIAGLRYLRSLADADNAPAPWT